MPEITIIILTFNSIRYIKPCLDSVFAQDYQDFEVIVVDNGSTDSTVSFIKENRYPVILIENKENLGACKGRNQGIEVSKGEWILFLDCDAILEKNFLIKIIKLTGDSEDSIGIVQSKILNMDEKTIYSCGIFLSKFRRFYDIGKGKKDKGQFDRPRYVFGACSAAGFYKRKMLEDLKEETGYFDERFFFLVEDVDLAWRAQKKGWKALYYPVAICYHYGNSSSLDKVSRQFLCWRNRKFLLKKYQLGRFKSVIISFFYDLPRLIFLFLTNPYVRHEILNKDK